MRRLITADVLAGLAQRPADYALMCEHRLAALKGPLFSESAKAE